MNNILQPGRRLLVMSTLYQRMTLSCEPAYILVPRSTYIAIRKVIPRTDLRRTYLQTDNVQVYCPEEQTEDITISNIGILQLRTRCTGGQLQITLSGNEIAAIKTNYFYLPKTSLNMSTIAPRFTTALQGQNAPAQPTVKQISPTTLEWPSIKNSESLHEKSCRPYIERSKETTIWYLADWDFRHRL